MTIWHDLRFAARTLRRSPGFVVSAMLTLALGIGATTTLFSALYAVVLQPLPYPDADRIMLISGTASMPGRGAITMGWSYPKFRDLRNSVKGFDELAAFMPWDVNVTGTESPERIRAELVTGNYFALLDVKPLVGRTFTADDDRAPNAHPVTLISQRLWEQRFGSDPQVIGKSLTANQVSLTIVGVLPKWFFGESGRAELWMPTMMAPALMANPRRLDMRMAHWLIAIGRVSEGVSATQADGNVKVAVQHMESQQPSGPPFDSWSGSAQPLIDSKVDPLMRRSLTTLLGAVGAVLLVGCFNLANLLLGRALARSREVGICLSLGANRWALVRRFGVESFVLAALGGGAGLLVAAWSIDLLRVLQPQGVWQGEAAFVRGLDFRLVEISAPTVVFTAVLALASAIVFGALPAWLGSRSNLTEVTRGADPGLLTAGPKRLYVRRALIVAQIAVACVLLAGAGLMIASFTALVRTELGFTSAGIATARIDLPAPKYEGAAAAQFLDALRERLRALPGVQDVSVSNTVPLRGLNEITRGTIDGVVQVEETAVHMVSPTFFRTFGIPLKQGRLLEDTDRAGTRHVALINETTARRFWPDSSPIGHRIALSLQGWSDPNDQAEIVGVVGDTKYRGIGMAPGVDVYLSNQQRSHRLNVIAVRAEGDPLALMPAIRAAVAGLDSTLPTYEATTMDQTVGNAAARTRFSASLITFFAGSALLLAAIGLYGVIAFGVAQRTREIGIRLALGADRPNVVWGFVREGVMLGAIGLAIGVPLALGLSGMLRGMLYEVRPGDPATLMTVAAGLLATCLAAAYIPARRAARIDPSSALRYE